MILRWTYMAKTLISDHSLFRGPNHSCSTACATGAHSVGEGLRLLQNGAAEVIDTKYSFTQTSINYPQMCLHSKCQLHDSAGDGVRRSGRLHLSSWHAWLLQCQSSLKTLQRHTRGGFSKIESKHFKQNIRWQVDLLMPNEMVL